LKKLTLITCLLLVSLASACQSATDDESQFEPTQAASPEPGQRLPAVGLTVAAPGLPEEYPPPIESYPVESPPPIFNEPTGYPVGPFPTSTPFAYPAGAAFWIARPAGLQCESPTYENLNAATSALEAEGIEVQEALEANLIVCQACGCPTSQTYRVLIKATDLTAAEALGWTKEPG
jgi:hypothetical protein